MTPTTHANAENPPAHSSATLASRKAAGAVVWLGSTTILWQVLSWILTLFTARILNPTDYGLIALAETIIPYLSLIGTLNLGTWMVQTDKMEKDDEQAMFSLTLVMGFVMALVAYFIAPLVSAFYEAPRLLLPFQILAFTFVLRAFQTVPRAMLHRQLEFKSVAIMNLCVGVLRGVLQLVLALFGAGFWALVIGIVFGDAGRAVWLQLARPMTWKFRWNMALYKKAFKFGATVTLSAVFWIIFSTTDDVVVGKFFSIELLGFYSMAFFLTDLPMAKLNAVIRPVLLPLFSRLRDDPQAMCTAFLRILRGIAGLALPALAGLFVVAHEATYVLLGDKWAELVTPLRVMCFVGMVRAFTTDIEPLLQAIGKPGRTTVFNGLRALIMPPAFILGAWLFGVNGVYAAWLTIFPALSIYILLALEKEIGISPVQFIINLRAPVVGAFLMGLTTFFVGAALQSLTASLLVILIVKILIGVASYVLFLRCLFPKDCSEIFNGLRELRSKE